MVVTKADVEEHIKKVEMHLNNGHERNLKGLSFAELYRKANEPELAKRHVLTYISVNGNDYRAHKLLGELLEDSGDYFGALASYKRCLILNSNQNDVLLKIVKLYTELEVDPKIAKVWADKASKQIPGHPAIFNLQVHLIELKKPVGYEELINLIAEELTKRPRDHTVHIKLIETYIKTNQLEEAFDHCVAVNKTKAFNDNLSWFVFTVNVLERYLEWKELQVKDRSPQSRLTSLQEVYMNISTSYCILVELNLKEASLRNSSRSLLRLDQLLHQAVNLDNGLSNSTDLIDVNEWDVAITEVRAQLYMLSGHLLLRLAKEGYSAWSKALEMSTVCYITSLRAPQPEIYAPWVAQASRRQRNPYKWSIMAASRISQTGHLVQATLDRYGEEKVEQIVTNWCSPQGQEDIITTLYGHNHDFNKLFLSEDESFLTSELIIPEHLITYDEVFIKENPLNLQVIVWIGLHWYQHDQHIKPGVGVLASRLFDGLRMDVPDVRQCSSDFICLRDIEAFIYAVVKCSAQSVLDNVDVVYEYYEPKLLPICLSSPFCVPSQYHWWNGAFTLYNGTVSVSNSGKVKLTVQRGLEQIRALRNHGMHPRLLIYLATNFRKKAMMLKDAAGYSPWHYSEHWKSLELRSLHYWKVALALLEDLKRNKNPGIPKDPLFPNNLSHLEEHDINRYFREASVILGEDAVQRGDFELALKLFNQVETSHAAWNEAQIYKYLAGLESSGADVDDRAYATYMGYLNEAKEHLVICLERLEHNKVVRDAVEQELAELELLLQERKPFYRVDPRKSLDFHQFDFDSIRSPVSSDITESGEPTPLKENDTRELLATVSEVTLDNGFLREQVSLRDEQVLRLSKQLQALQDELHRVTGNEDLSSTSMSYPFARTPSSSLNDLPPATNVSQLDVEDKFTRQGTFTDNTVVPTDRFDDPSFFSGLSASNTPESKHTKQDEEENVNRTPEVTSLVDETQEKSGSEDMNNDEDDIHFEPIVQLPLVIDMKSGEEDEDVVFQERVKLFRYDSDNCEWKERGIGDLKLLWNPNTSKARILMRREKIHKVCANHFLTPYMSLQPGKGSAKCRVWSSLADSSDEETKPVQFAAKFVTEEAVQEFEVKFKELQQRKPMDKSKIFSPLGGFLFGQQEVEKESSFSSTPCNSSQFSIGTTAEDGYLPVTSSSPMQQHKFVFSSTGAFAEPIQRSQKVIQTSSLSSLSSEDLKSNNQKTTENTIQFGGHENSDMFKSPAFKTQEHQGQGSRPQAQPLPPQKTERMSTFSFTFPYKPELSNESSFNQLDQSTTASHFPKESANDTRSVSEDRHIFGTGTSLESFNFNAISNQYTDKKGPDSSSKNTQFAGFGRHVFSQPNNDKEHHDDEEIDDIDIKPIVSLPLIQDRLTGEEEETVRFSERAKLFRFANETKEWKERGTGVIKLLYNPSTGKSRVVMRRDQVHKICANHVILQSMKLRANDTSDRSWMWYTPSDISNGEATSEKLAVKFKQKENASEFKKIFEELQSIAPTSKSCDPDADLDTSSCDGSSFSRVQRPVEKEFHQNSLESKFKASPGSWQCGTCLVRNKKETTHCVACTSSKNGTEKVKQSSLSSTGFKWSFEKPVDNVKSDSPQSTSTFQFGLPKTSSENVSRSISESRPNGLVSESQETQYYKPAFNFGSQKSNQKGFKFGQSCLPNKDNIQPSQASFIFGSKTVATESNKPAGSLLPGHPTFCFNTDISSPSDPANTETVFPDNSLTTMFQRPEGSWKCETCLVSNSKDALSCIACTTPKPGTSDTLKQNSPFPTQPAFSFNTNTSSSNALPFGTPNQISQTPASSKSPFFLGNNVAPSSGFKFGFQTPSSKETSKSDFTFPTSTADTLQSGFVFGSPAQTKSSKEPENKKPEVKKPDAVDLSHGKFSFRLDVSKTNKTPETSPVKHQDDDDESNTEEEDENLVFQPIVSLPKDIEKITGEENEIIKFQNHAKLYRYNDGMWKERGVGEMKILFDPRKHRGRVVMRRDQVHKLCANHNISRDMVLKPHGPSQKCWMWHTSGDIADNEIKDEVFAVKFPSPEIALSFRDAFEYCSTNQSSLSGDNEKLDEEMAKTITNEDQQNTSSNLKSMFQPLPGSWACDVCLVQNPEDTISCAACRAPKPDSESSKPDSSLVGQPAFSLNRDVSSESDPNIETVHSKKDLALMFQRPENSWKCETCLVSNSKDTLSCIACTTPKPGTSVTLKQNNQPFPTQPAFSLNRDVSSESDPNIETGHSKKDLTAMFQRPEGSWKCETCLVSNSKDALSCIACTTPKPGTSDTLKQNSPFPTQPAFSFNTNTSSSNALPFGTPNQISQTPASSKSPFFLGNNVAPSSGFKFGFQTPSSKETSKSDFTFPTSTADTLQSGFVFGSPAQTKSSKEPENKKPEVKKPDAVDLSHGKFTFRLDVSKTNKTPETSPVKHQDDDDESNTEEEDENLVFQPIVSLPKDIEKITGEENEIIKFQNHAKLYRYNDGMWKERGVGEMKILFDPRKHRGRVVMRRDQVHKLCANHNISRDMVLKPHGPSQKCWMWHTSGDFSSDEIKQELFAVKFIDPEIALAFKDAFEYCGNSQKSSSPSDLKLIDDDVVELVHEECATVEQRAQAEKLLLPPNFYLNPAKTTIGETTPDEKTQKSLVASSQTAQENSTESFLFGSSDMSSLTFGSLASGLSSNSGFTKSPPNKGYFGTGQKLFEVNKGNEEENDPENESNEIHFQPIVHLGPQVERSTGEENEEIVYCERAKLYRFEKGISQWKERGVGNLKLLKHKTTGQVRVLMRREQVLKLCANHFLTADMELKPNAGTDRSWVWQTMGDFSDGEAKEEKLAVRFKNTEMANQFKEMFELCQKEQFGSTDNETVVGTLNVNRTMSNEENKQERSYQGGSTTTTAAAAKEHGSTGKLGTHERSGIKEKPGTTSVLGNDAKMFGTAYEDSTITEKLSATKKSETTHHRVSSPTTEDLDATTKSYSDHLQDTTSTVFQFGSLETSSLSFGALAAKTTGFGKSDKLSDGFAGAGKTLFGQPSNENKNDYDDDAEKERDGLDFQPIVLLSSNVDLETGEEDESVVYSHRVKLYRFDSEVKQWKERGVGIIKILENEKTNHFRVVMRREQIHKICANHFITAEIELKENSDRSWMWSVPADFSDGVAKHELLSVRFKHRADGLEFQEKFIQCQEKLKGQTKEASDNEEVVENGDDVVITFEKIPSEQQKKLALKYELPETFYCEDVSQQDTDDQESFPEAREEYATTEKPVKIQSLSTADESATTKDFTITEKLTAMKDTSPTTTEDLDTETKSYSDHLQDTTSTVFQFGSLETSSLSFGALAAKTTGFGKSDKLSDGFAGAGKTLFGQPCNENKNDYDDAEKERDGLHFQPIVLLSNNVDLETGEEDESVLYSHRVKLYRFDSEVKQWKERGVGIIKILENEKTNHFRVVMRREQIHKICANHYITPEIELKENSDRSWMWSVTADFSDGVAKHELLSARFKHRADGLLFREKFIECQEKLKEQPQEKLTSETSENEKVIESDDDVVITFEKIPSDQQKQLAIRYELPETFYCMEMSDHDQDVSYQQNTDDQKSNQDSNTSTKDDTTKEQLTKQSFSTEDDSATAEDFTITEKLTAMKDTSPTTTEDLDTKTKSYSDHLQNTTSTVFQFGSLETSSLSFGALAAKTTGFGKSDKLSDGFAGAGKTLFGQPSNENKNDYDDDAEKERNGLDFQPIVLLSNNVDLETGEEDESVVYSHRVKLYRFDSEVKQWKERGVGIIKILENEKTNHFRVVMRREQIHKICANHYITPEIELKENSDRSWMWSVTADFSDGVAKHELLSARFKHRADGLLFREKFIECQEKLKEQPQEKLTSENEEDVKSDDDVVITFEKIPSDQQKKHALKSELPQTFFCEGVSGDENVPLQLNANDGKSGGINGSDDDEKLHEVSSNEQDKLSSLMNVDHSQTLSAGNTGESEPAVKTTIVGDGVKSFTKLTYAKVAATGISKNVEIVDDHALGGTKPRGSDNKVSNARSITKNTKPLKTLSGNGSCTGIGSPDKQSDTGSDLSVDALELSADTQTLTGDVQSTGTDKSADTGKSTDTRGPTGTGVIADTEQPANNVESINKPVDLKTPTKSELLPTTDTLNISQTISDGDESCISKDLENSTLFGPQETASISFGSLAPQTTGFGASKPSTHDENDYDPEKETDGAEFQPVASLPSNVDLETGEEDESVVYSHRVRLYRFDSEVKQWKERGVGIIKILENKKTNHFRVVMRREQTNKICANHYITPEIELKENTDRSWVWSVAADFSDRVAKHELLSARFKHRADGSEFQKKFTECQERIRQSSGGRSCVVNETGKEDDVVITYENIPSPEEKHRAQRQSLPERFFAEGRTKPKSTKRSSPLRSPGVTRSCMFGSSAISSLSFGAIATGLSPKSKSPKTSPRGSGSVSSRSQLFGKETKHNKEDVHEERNELSDASSVNDEKSHLDKPSQASSHCKSQSFVIGAPAISSLSFASMAGSISSKPSHGKSHKKEFMGAGTPIFEEKKEHKTPEEYDPEDESIGVHFRPIVHLGPQVERSTGEENEEIVYCERAKLYRFEKGISQWKERGVGNLKLLKHKTTGQVRVLMRREQVLKLCANHFLTADMELKPNAGSDRSWVWQTMGDFSDGEAKEEKLAVRFKNVEMAKQFKDKFDICKEELNSTAKINELDDGDSDETGHSYEEKRSLFGWYSRILHGQSLFSLVWRGPQTSETKERDLKYSPVRTEQAQSNENCSVEEASAGYVSPNEHNELSTITSNLSISLKKPKKLFVDLPKSAQHHKSNITEPERPALYSLENNNVTVSPSSYYTVTSKQTVVTAVPNYQAEPIVEKKIITTPSVAPEFATYMISTLVRDHNTPSRIIVTASALFSHEAKIFTFDHERWLEKGSGLLQIIDQDHRFHIFMIDSSTSTICVAHEIFPAMDLKPNAGSDRSWVWFTLADHSDEPASPHQLAAEFPTVEASFEFKRKFEECRDLSGVPHEGHVLAMAASFNSNVHELPKMITTQKKIVEETRSPLWRTCQNCHVENNVSNASCLVCGAGLDQSVMGGQFVVKKLQIINVKSTTGSTSKPQPHRKPKKVEKDAPETAKEAKSISFMKWWKCSGCGVENNERDKICGICSLSKQLKPENPSTQSPLLEPRSEQIELEQPNALPFTSLPEVLSFSNIASSSSFQISTSDTGFPGSGSQLFEKTSEDDVVTGDVERSVDKTEDGNEECILKQHVKLLRFDSSVGEWKEKGSGTLKILKNAITQRARIVMYRDKVLSLCANHCISATMELRPPDDTDKVWMWTAQDYSSGEMVIEQLAAVFKNDALAVDFKNAVDHYRNKDSSTTKPEFQLFDGRPTCSPHISRLLSEMMKK